MSQSRSDYRALAETYCEEVSQLAPSNRCSPLGSLVDEVRHEEESQPGYDNLGYRAADIRVYIIQSITVRRTDISLTLRADRIR